MEDQRGIIWAGSFGEGVVFFNGSIWEHWNKKNSPLKDDLVFNIFSDSKNNKWISTYFGGIFIYNEKGVKF